MNARVRWEPQIAWQPEQETLIRLHQDSRRPNRSNLLQDSVVTVRSHCAYAALNLDTPQSVPNHLDKIVLGDSQVNMLLNFDGASRVLSQA